MSAKVPFPIPRETLKEKRFYHVPMGLCDLVFQKRLFKEFRLFMYFKSVCKGQISPGSNSFSDAAKVLKISQRTVKRHFETLREMNWIGRFKSGTYIIRGFDKLRIMEKCPGKYAVYFDKEEHLQNFQAFIVSACFGHLINKQKSKLARARLKESKRGISRGISRTLPTHYNIACRALTQIYGISTGTSLNYKRLGKEAGYLDIIHTLRPMNIDNGLEWKRAHPEQAHLLIRRDDKYFLQYPDKIKCNLTFTRRRSLSQLDKK